MSDLNFNNCPPFCGALQHPGLAVNFDLYVDYSCQESTEDQQRIEAVLDNLISSGEIAQGSRVLHIGVGNSRFAAKFTAQGIKVDGITVSESEQQLGESLKLNDYQVYVANKYHRDFTGYFEPKQFDVIVDNNLASFSCCQYHFYQMLENYLGCLKTGGKILTDQRGMDWALAGPGFILDFEKLTGVVANLPLKVSRLTNMVYALELLPEKAKPQSLSVYARRNGDDGQAYIETFIPQAG
ncbi:SAM-dependent methyltransferase [Thalassomonas haliotis]|uniref:Class I SAM-dependent methyltransferase n=1 Tax=Thalassomonas haliotis TaxID=485448 RepID=A0ABY7VLD7_9GAMM|nr:class I SAM-dependent methyltransferase [Thalassomonas haliotis]WDE14313.1 class I SAM-dependent methyltransferase [Thalassomonas haliotis]